MITRPKINGVTMRDGGLAWTLNGVSIDKELTSVGLVRWQVISALAGNLSGLKLF
jgi:hypothetical protein